MLRWLPPNASGLGGRRLLPSSGGRVRRLCSSSAGSSSAELPSCAPPTPSRLQLFRHARHAAIPMACALECTIELAYYKKRARPSQTKRQADAKLCLRDDVLSLAQVGFGFMDNIIMIQAGDCLSRPLLIREPINHCFSCPGGRPDRHDSRRHARLLHTDRRRPRERALEAGTAHVHSIYRDTSWRLPQVCSDTSGTLFGGVVETLAARLQLTPANLSPEQLKMRISRQWALGGATVGVICGCLLGMSTLCFMDLEKSDRLKRAAELDTIFTHVVEHGYKLLGAERCTLFLHDAGKAELWTKMSTGSKRGQDGRQRLAAC